MISTVRIWVDKIISNPMVEGRRTRALARAIKWQLGKRLGFGRALVEIGPAHIYCYPGHAAASGALYTGFMEWDEMSFTVRFLRADDHFVDVGANVGTYSVFAAAFAPGVRVTSVEPGDAARRRLTENLALNGLAVDRVVSSAIVRIRFAQAAGIRCSDAPARLPQVNHGVSRTFRNRGRVPELFGGLPLA